MTVLEKAMELRSGVVSPNCAETMLMAYAEEMGLTEEQAKKLGTNFGGGMKTGSVCGVVTGAMIVLSMLGITDPQVVSDLQKRVKANHGGKINCADLLKANAEAGGLKKPHCDAMIREVIEMIEEYREEME